MQNPDKNRKHHEIFKTYIQGLSAKQNEFANLRLWKNDKKNDFCAQ